MDYVFHICIWIGIYTILATSLNVTAGCTGLLSLAHAAFYGIGAYAAALMSLHVGTPMLLNMALGLVLASGVAALISMPTLRLRDDYFVISTFALQVVVFRLLENCVVLTGGPMGLPNIPRAALGPWQIESRVEFLVLTLGVCGAVVWICRRIILSPFGRILNAIREDEIVTGAAGKDVPRSRMVSVAIGGALASLAGGLHAHYMMFVDPSSFTIMESVFIVAIMIVGGAGTVWGPLLGAVILVTLPEALRFVGLPSAVAANVRQILYGGLLVVFVALRPQGLLGEHASTFSSKRGEM